MPTMAVAGQGPKASSGSPAWYRNPSTWALPPLFFQAFSRKLNPEWSHQTWTSTRRGCWHPRWRPSLLCYIPSHLLLLMWFSWGPPWQIVCFSEQCLSTLMTNYSLFYESKTLTSLCMIQCSLVYFFFYQHPQILYFIFEISNNVLFFNIWDFHLKNYLIINGKWQSFSTFEFSLLYDYIQYIHSHLNLFIEDLTWGKCSSYDSSVQRNQRNLEVSWRSRQWRQ